VVISASHKSVLKTTASSSFLPMGRNCPTALRQAIEARLDYPIVTVEAHQLGRAPRRMRMLQRATLSLQEHLPLIISICAGDAESWSTAHMAQTYHIAPHVLHRTGRPQVIAHRPTEPNGFNINDECGATHTQAPV